MIHSTKGGVMKQPPINLIYVIDHKPDELERATTAISEICPKATIQTFTKFGDAARVMGAEVVPDTLLTDLMYPYATELMSHPAEWKDREEPAGLMMVMIALLAGVKRIGIVSDINHHDHPVAALQHCFELWSSKDGRWVKWVRRQGAIALSSKGTPVLAYNGKKDWGVALQQLLEKPFIAGTLNTYSNIDAMSPLSKGP